MTLILAPLLLTVLLEGGGMLALTRRWDAVYYSFLCNLVTNPTVNLVLWCAVRLWPGGYWPALILLELAVVPVEGWILLRLLPWTKKRAFLTAALLNSFSFGMGLLFNLFL